jgi:putative endonuclease
MLRAAMCGMMKNLEKLTEGSDVSKKAGQVIGEEPRWYAYLLRCSDGSLYCGVTIDIVKRLKAHNSGTASKYTKPRRPVSLLVSVGPMHKSEALSLEMKTKRLPREKKAAYLSQRQLSLRKSKREGSPKDL